MAPAMHERPRPLWSSQLREPVIAVVSVALQEAPVKARQELFGKSAAAPGCIAEQHDRRTWAAMATIVGGDRPEVAFLRLKIGRASCRERVEMRVGGV